MTHALEVLWRDAPMGAPLTALTALGLARLPRRALQGACVAVALLVALVLLDHRPGLAEATTRHRLGVPEPTAVSGP